MDMQIYDVKRCLDVEIRQATLKDINEIAVLYQEFYALNALSQPEYYQEATETGAYSRSVIESRQGDLLIATEADAVIGLIHVEESKTPPYAPIVQHRFAEVIDLIVETSFRKKGVGTLLINAARQWAKNRGLDYLELFVLSENQGGIAFYHRTGFRTVSHNMRLTV